MPARGRGRFPRAALAQLRAAVAKRAPARALRAALSPHPRRRVPGHQPAAVPLAEAAVRAGDRDLRGRRRRPVDLCVPRRERGQHGRLRAGLQGREGDPPRAELPLARQYPGRGQRADRQQRQSPWQEPVDRGRLGRADPRVRGRVRHGRGALDRRGSPGPRARWRALPGHGGPVPLERAVEGAGTCPVLGGRFLSRLWRPAVLRAGRDQARAGVPAPRGEPRGRQRLPADRQLPAAWHRRAGNGNVAGCGQGREPAALRRHHQPRRRQGGQFAGFFPRDHRRDEVRDARPAAGRGRGPRDRQERARAALPVGARRRRPDREPRRTRQRGGRVQCRRNHSRPRDRRDHGSDRDGPAHCVPRARGAGGRRAPGR